MPHCEVSEGEQLGELGEHDEAVVGALEVDLQAGRQAGRQAGTHECTGMHAHARACTHPYACMHAYTQAHTHPCNRMRVPAPTPPCPKEHARARMHRL